MSSVMSSRRQSKRKHSSSSSRRSSASHDTAYYHSTSSSEDESRNKRRRQRPSSAAASSSQSHAQSQPACSICYRDQTENDSSWTCELRVLAGCCDRIVCRACLVKLMTGPSNHRRLSCPFCRKNHSFPNPNRERDVALIRQKSIFYATTFLERNNLVSLDPAKAVKCSESLCNNSATHYCADLCAEQCEFHFNHTHHFMFNFHKTMPIGEKNRYIEAQKREAQEVEIFAVKNERGNQLEKAAEYLKESLWQLPCVKTLTEARRNQLDLDAKALDQLQENIESWKYQINLEKSVLEARVADLTTSRKSFRGMIEQQLATIKSQQLALGAPTTISSIVIATDAEHKQMCDLTHVAHKKAEFDDEVERKRIQFLNRPTQLPVVGLLQELNAPTLLTSITYKQRRELQRFFGPGINSFQNLNSPQYKMSRDGASIMNFAHWCCDQGPLLILIRSATTRYTFGAYISVSLPYPSIRESTGLPYQCPPIADQSETSFIFSLSNQYSTPFKLNLRSKYKSNAFKFTDKGAFLIGVGRPNGNRLCHSFSLFNSLPACDREANFSNQHTHRNNDMSFELDESSFDAENPKPAYFNCEAHVFAGTQTFPAEEIEVYRI